MDLLSLYRSHDKDSVTPIVGTSATGRSANSRGHIGMRSLYAHCPHIRPCSFGDQYNHRECYIGLKYLCRIVGEGIVGLQILHLSVIPNNYIFWVTEVGCMNHTCLSNLVTYASESTSYKNFGASNNIKVGSQSYT